MDTCIVCGFPALPKHPIIDVGGKCAHWRCALHAAQMVFLPENAGLTIPQLREKASKQERARIIVETANHEHDD